MLSFISIGAFPINIGTFALKFEALVINEKKIYCFCSQEQVGKVATKFP